VHLQWILRSSRAHPYRKAGYRLWQFLELLQPQLCLRHLWETLGGKSRSSGDGLKMTPKIKIQIECALISGSSFLVGVVFGAIVRGVLSL
jgi:hypothetical protein